MINNYHKTCDFCDNIYSIEWRKYNKTYYSCYMCENILHEKILTDELKNGKFTTEKWFSPLTSNFIYNINFIHENNTGNFVSTSDITIYNYNDCITNNNYMVNENNYRVCDYVCFEKDKIHMCFEEVDESDYYLDTFERNYVLHIMSIKRLSLDNFHLPIPIIKNKILLDNNRYILKRLNLETKINDIQNKITKAFVLNNRCIIILRIISRRIYSEHSPSIYILPNDIIENIINMYLDLPQLIDIK